jgi:ABC-type branched-subunit amino acid transport system substrate-binding protein
VLALLGGAVATGMLAIGVLGVPVPRAAAESEPDMSPPLPEVSPFSGSDAFCARPDGSQAVPLTASVPGLTPTDLSAAVVLPPGSDATGPAATAVARFVQLVNQCGGVQGRRLRVRTIEASSDPAADCAALVGAGPFAVVAGAGPFPAAPCLATRGSTVVVDPASTASNAVLAAAHGRLFVGGSSEGTLEARVQDLVDHADLSSAPFGILTETGTDADPRFAAALTAALAAAGLHPKPAIAIDPATPTSVEDAAAAIMRAHLRAVLGGHPIPGLVRALSTRKDPPAVFALAGPSAGDGSEWNGADRAAVERVSIETWIEPTDVAAQEEQDPSDFVRHCRDWLVAASPRSSTTTSTTPSAVIDRGTIDACLAVRLLARGLEQAGPNPTPRDIVRAFHNLPNTDRPGLAGAPTVQPSQLVNEPVRRAARVVVRNRLTIPCPASVPPRSTPAPAACWQPVGGYGDGGQAILARVSG